MSGGRKNLQGRAATWGCPGRRVRAVLEQDVGGAGVCWGGARQLHQAKGRVGLLVRRRQEHLQHSGAVTAGVPAR